MVHSRILILLILCINALIVQGQEEIPLYKNEIPKSKYSVDVNEKILPSNDGITRIANVVNPLLYAYFPAKETNNKRAILIFPGGGYGILAISHEGHDVAKKFAAQGIAAFVVKYRLPDDEIMIQKENGPLQDAQRAIQLVREHAKEWGIDSNKVGIAGFSAGGHLASTLGTHYQHPLIDNPYNINLRPDFMVLVYPVISMKDEITHKGSQLRLLGANPSLMQLTKFSNEMQVDSNTPPTFLIHAEDDKAVTIKNSLQFKEALEAQHVEVKLLTYQKGGHGFGLNNPTSDVQWFPQVVHWITEL